MCIVLCCVHSPVPCFFFLVALSSFLFPFTILFLQHWTTCLSLSLSLSFPTRMMDSLELAPLLLLLLHKPSASPPTQPNSSLAFIRQVQPGVFPSSLLKRAAKNGKLRLTRSFSSDPESGVGAAGPFPYKGNEKDNEEEEEEGHHHPNPPSKQQTSLVLSREIDDFGFLVGFRLIPDSGTMTEDVRTSDKVEKPEAEGVEEEKPRTRVSYNIVFVTAEAAPYSKTGGLGDVCGSLPIALAARGHRVMVVSPRYIHGTSEDLKLSGAVDMDCCTKIYCFGGVQEVGFFHEYRQGVDWVFVDHPSYHRSGNPYGDKYGTFGDNQFRFTLLCHAACEAPLVLPLGGFTYGEKCLFLVNDWHASLVPLLLASKYRPHGIYKDARSILVIHNIAHQGVEPAITYGNLGIPPEWHGALEWVFPNWARMHALDTGEAVNFLKGAIVTADRIVTVSKGYSWEITTSEGGYGLHELLSSRKSILNGIINGIDVTEWNPSSDEHIACNYSADDLSGKVKCKVALQKELGLPVRPDCPLIGFIGRLDYQKGIDLICMATPELMEDDVQFVMLGSGNPSYVSTFQVMLGSGNPVYEDWMRATEAAYRDRFRGWVGFNVPISHRITAGCDILLMPSTFEPCGLNQLYAMRYGTIPVVHHTGGLRDTVQNFNPYVEESSDQGTGWTFSPLTKESMLTALRYAIQTYNEYKSSWDGLMKRGMARDYTWVNAASQYEQVIEWAFMDPPYC